MTYIHTDTSLTVLSCDDQWRWKCIFSNRLAWFWFISNNCSFSQGFPAVLYLISPIAGQTGAGCRHKELLYTSSGRWTSKNLIFPLKFGLLVSLYLCNKHARFHWDIFQTGPMIKIWLLENCRWPWPRKHWCCNVQFTSKIVRSTYRHQMFARLIKKAQCYYKSSSFYLEMGVFMMKMGLAISFQFEIFFFNAERFHVGLCQEISVRNHMCQCSTCFMEDRCMFIWFVVAYGGFIWFYWLQSMLKFNVLDFHGQPVGSDKNYFFNFHHYYRYLNQIWSAHRYNTVILAGQVSREIMQGNLLKGCTALLMT